MMDYRQLFRDRVKQALPQGMQSALRQLRAEMSIWRAHRGSVRRALRSYSDLRGLKLNIGCGGPNRKAGWVNIDLVPAADLQLDMREPIPLADGSATIIYSEHFFEHLDHPKDTSHFLSESFRILEPGGTFSLGVPNSRWALFAYVSGDEGEEYLNLAKKWHPSWATTYMDHINYEFRQDGEHRYAYDFETLQKMLAAAGFVDIAQRDFDPTLDSEDRRPGTLYIDCRKPLQPPS